MHLLPLWLSHYGLRLYKMRAIFLYCTAPTIYQAEICLVVVIKRRAGSSRSAIDIDVHIHIYNPNPLAGLDTSTGGLWEHLYFEIIMVNPQNMVNGCKVDCTVHITFYVNCFLM